VKGAAFFHDPRHRADGAMLLVTVFWGLTFPFIRVAVRDLHPFVFVAARFVLALLVFLPVVLFSRRTRQGLKRALLAGAVLGALAWAGYLAQTMGLRTVTAGRAAFITGLSVILVPLLSPVFRAGRPRPLEIAAAVVATFGLFLLTDPGGEGITHGDLLVLVCAGLYAVYIHAIQIFLRKEPDAFSLTFVQIASVAALALLALPLADAGPQHFSGMAIAALLFTATFATGGTFWLQAHYQSRTTPQRVALIFSMEPVFATVFAYLMLGETLSGIGQMGALLIFISVLGVELLDRPPARPEGDA